MTRDWLFEDEWCRRELQVDICQAPDWKQAPEEGYGGKEYLKGEVTSGAPEMCTQGLYCGCCLYAQPERNQVVVAFFLIFFHHGAHRRRRQGKIQVRLGNGIYISGIFCYVSVSCGSIPASVAPYMRLVLLSDC